MLETKTVQDFGEVFSCNALVLFLAVALMHVNINLHGIGANSAD